MDQSVRDYIQSQALLLPFQSTLDQLVQSTLAALHQDDIDVNGDDDCFLRELSGGSFAGVSEERWVLSEGELGMVKRVKKGLRRVENQERVDASEYPQRLCVHLTDSVLDTQTCGSSLPTSPTTSCSLA